MQLSPALEQVSLCLAAFLVTAATAYADEAPVMRREASVRFELDPAFQADGGVQYFYELAEKEPSPETASKAFALFRAFDVTGAWAARTEPLNVVMSRIVYTMEKDSSFFNPRRAKDVDYLNAVAPGLDITRVNDDTYRTSATPANSFRIRWLDSAAVKRLPREEGLTRLLELCASPALPDSVVVQDNSGFAKVLGWRTGEASFTWTAHYPLAPGRTRVCVFTMSYLHNLPPFFMGGEGRVFSESVNGAATLIRNLRAYRPPAAVK
jgi:hypothetical protein